MNIRDLIAVVVLITATTASPAQTASAHDVCATAPASCATLISTRGSASRRLVNSEVFVTVGITATNKELKEVQRQMAEHSAALLNFLRQSKVDRVTTETFNIAPQVVSQEHVANRIVGYNGNTSISFRASAERAPALLSGVLTNGGNTIEATTFQPAEEEVHAAQRELSAEAVHSALAEAASIAKAADLHVAAVKSITTDEQGAFTPRPLGFALRINNGTPPAAIDTAAGEQRITVTVSLVVAATR